MVLVEDEDVIVYSLPKQKSRPKNMYHSLKEARQNARILINKYQLKENNLASFFLMILVTYPSIIVMFFYINGIVKVYHDPLYFVINVFYASWYSITTKIKNGSSHRRNYHTCSLGLKRLLIDE